MEALVFIGLLGLFSYHSFSNYDNFGGSSMLMKQILGLAGNFGYIIWFIVWVWSFWHFAWWQPIVTIVLSMMLSGLSAPLFQKTAIGIFVTPILVVVSMILSVATLISL
jgi:hypothetical protein